MAVERGYIGVVQVRYRSDELPGKSLLGLGDTTVLTYLLERLKSASFLKKLVVATTPEAEDDIVERQAAACGVPVYRGAADDVIRRLYGAVKDGQPYGIVRILGNTPLVDIRDMEEMLRLHRDGGYDYAYNEHVNGVIFGMGCSVFSYKILEELTNNQSLTPEQREIGSLYIRQHPEKFKILKKDAVNARPLYRVTLDEPRDAELIKSIIGHLPVIDNDTVGEYLDQNPLLTVYQKGSTVSETGVDKLFLFPSKIEKYLTASFDTTYPVSVELSLTNVCNFDCEWCSDSGLRERLGGEFSVDDMRRLFHDLKEGGTKGVVIEGGGEPMIHKDFRAIALLAAETGLALGMITNGSVPLDADLIPLFEWVRVSLDAATPEQHAKAKKVHVFERVMENIKHLGEHKGKTTIGVGYVVTRENIDNLENLLLRLRNYKVDYIQLRPVIDCPHLWPDTDLAFLKKYETAAFRVDIGAMYANDVRGNAGKACVAHSISTVITADGGVYLCGRLNIYDWVKPIGNLHAATFNEIWHGEERRLQAGKVADPAFCKEHCPECRMTKYNILIDRARNFKTRSFI